ncbi:MAG: hypothetical protein R3195_04445 [Gemmatimonadota bacterium]|nr:hypothetical protein [Gemmatimonadota bacterium]
MRYLRLAVAASALALTLPYGEVAAQQGNDITESELARHGYAMPPETEMVILIANTGTTLEASCQIHDGTAGRRADLGSVEGGGQLLSAVDVRQMPGPVWIQCIEAGDGKRFTSNNIQSVGRTLVHFSTGTHFVVTQKIVPDS